MLRPAGHVGQLASLADQQRGLRLAAVLHDPEKKTGGTKPPAQMSKPSETEREEVWVSW